MFNYNNTRLFLRKLILTLRNFKKTAYHHYGHSPKSFFKLFYYSGLKANTFIVFESNLLNIPKPVSLGSYYEVTKPTIDELKKIRNGRDLPREFYYDVIYNAKKYYLVFKKGEVASIHWVFHGKDYSRFFKLSDYIAELNYFTVLPEFRGDNLMFKMTILICNDLKDAGYKKAVTAIHELNHPAVRCFDKANFERTATIKTIGPFNKKLKIT